MELEYRFKAEYEDDPNCHLITMNPQDFLKLTTDKPDDFIRKAGKLDHDLWESADEIPYLEVDFKTGRVSIHEGRHRAAAFVNSRIEEFPVAITLIDLEMHKKVVAMKLPESAVLNDDRIFPMPEKFLPEYNNH